MVDDYEAYQRLADAIVCRAIKDYRISLLRLRRNPKDLIAKQVANECEQFFRSEWCYFLSGMDADFILGKLGEKTC